MFVLGCIISCDALFWLLEKSSVDNTLMLSCCRAVLRRAKDVSACPALPVRGWEGVGPGQLL